MDDSGLKLLLSQKYKERLAKRVIARNFINEIIPNLFLGDLEGALANKDNFDIIINLSTYKYVTIPLQYFISIEDTPKQEIVEYINVCNKIIEDGLKNNKKILVHCFAGKSRSSSIILGYLMTTRNWTYEEAFDFVNKQRTSDNPIQPNVGFIYQLKKFVTKKS